ncbi:hypothetical protein ACJ3XI_04635 [Litorimonas sp. RW-G-Af-16]|uniref:hypothetical protein n=1 Tax=Litorimonas sp. RW-G-Af-16 TaxID=3241168 RepID=UPI00390C6B39
MAGFKYNTRRALSRLGIGIGLCAVVSLPTLAAVIDRPFFRAGPVVIVFSGSDFYENAWEAPIVNDFVLLEGVASGSAGNDIIAQDGVAVNFPFDPISNGDSGGWPFQVTGQPFGGAYNNDPSFQMLDANDSYTAFGVDDDTDIDLLGNQVRFAWFFVASNAAFDIYASASNLSASGDFMGLGYQNITYQFLEITPASPSIGQRAQSPSVGGGGVVLGNSNGDTLNDLSSGPVKVFDGGRRTARLNGSIAQQAAGFASVYRLRGAPINGNNYDFSMGVGKLSADVTYTVYAP